MLATLRVIFTHEGTLSQHGQRLALQLAKLLTHNQSRSVDEGHDGELLECGQRRDNSLTALQKLILTLWKI